MRIQGPDGTVANIDAAGRLYTLSTSLNVDQFLVTGGRTLSMVVPTVTPVGANDYFFYIKNNGTTNIAVGQISFMAAAPTTVWVDQVSGTPVYVTNGGAGSDPDVVNLRLGNPTQPIATIKYDTDITGIVQEGPLFFERCAVADTRYFLQTISGISIPTGQALAFRSSVSTAITMVSSLGIVLL